MSLRPERKPPVRPGGMGPTYNRLKKEKGGRGMSKGQVIVFLEHNATRGDVVGIIFVTITIAFVLRFILALIAGD